MFSLSGPCELYCFLYLSCWECDVISLYFMCCSGNGSVCLVCGVFDSVCELFGVVAILLLNCYGNV